MSTLFEAIKDRFDADGTLCPSPFSELFMGEPPEDEAIPFCVVVQGERTKTGGTFGGSKFWRQNLTIHCCGATQELVEGYAALVDAAFDGCETDLAVAGCHVILFDRQSVEPRQVEQDRWQADVVCAVDYEEY